MKRKWLIAIASLAMAISFVLGVSACAPKEDSKSDEEIAQAAINTLNSLYIKDGEVKNYETPDKYTVLGKVNVDDELYTVTWTAAAKTDGVNIADYVTVGEIDSKNQVEIGIKRATVDVEYTLTASVTVGKTTKTADYGHKIPKKSSEEAVTASLDLSDKANRTSLDVDNGEQVWQQNGITLTNTGDVADYAPVRLYKNTTVKIEMENAKIIHIDFHSASGFSDSPYPEYLLTSLQNSDLPIKGDIALAEDGLTISVDFETPQEVVTFKATAGQCRLTSIDVEAIERDPDEHVHKWTYEHVANTWTHTATCTAEGCDVKTKTEDCEPKLNVCECGYTYSAKEIVDALFALDTNGSLPGTYSLTGVVTEITDAYSTQYKNVTFDMEVEGQTITVFRAKGTYATEVAVGGTATVNGSLLDYSGKKEFTSGCAVVAFTPGVDERTADEKAEAALKKVAETLTITATGTQTLATSSEREVTFAWAVKSGDSLPDGITLADGKLSVTKLPEEEKTFQLVVTATIAEATQTHTKTVTVTVKPEGAATGFEPITAPAAGSDYYLAMDIKGTWYYSTGAMSSHFLGTTTDISKAAKVTVAASGSGWTLFTNGKYLEIEKVDTYNNIVLKDTATDGKVWMWDDEHAVFTMTVGSDTFFMGTYGTYTTFNAAYTSYLDNEDEYIGKIGTYTGSIEPDDPEPDDNFKPITAPAAGSDYFLAMDRNGTWYYSTGMKNGNYLGTTTDISKAAKVTVAASGSGWTLVTNGKYIEFETSEPNDSGRTYVNIMLKDAQTEGKVWMWNSEHSVFTMEEDGETYFMGTYGDYDTFNSAKLSFIDGADEYVGKIGTYTGSIEPPPAEEGVLYTLSTMTDQGSNSNYASNCDITVDGITWNIEGNTQMNPWRFGGKSIANPTDRKLSSKTAIKGTVKQVIITFGPATITVNSITFNVFKTDPTVAGAAATFTKTVEHSANGTVTVEAPDAGWTDCFYQIVFNVTNSASSNKYVSVNTIEFRSTVKTDVDEPDPEPEDDFKPIKTPAAAINYYMGMKTQDGKYHYITGSMASGSASHYMATVTDIAQAKRVTLSGNDTDGWTMMCEGKYIEIVKSGTYYNAVYTTTSSGTWKWDATHNFFTWTISGAVYALGTYGTFSTVGTVAESRFNDSGEWFAVLGLYGDETAQAPSDQNFAQQVLDSLTIPSATLNKVGASLTLPTSTAHGATVVWTATGENASLVTIEGTKLSVAKVPQTETTVTLHCVVTINDASVEKDFTVTVRDLNDKEKADAVVTALDKLFKDKTFWTLDKVSILPTENDYSATVVWTLAEAGKEYFKIEDNKLSVLKLYEGANHSNQKFTITLTVTVGEEVSTKDFTLYLYSPDTFTAETSAPEYGYYFIAAYDPAENPNNSSRRDLLNGTTLGTNGGTNGNLQSTTYDSSAQLFLIIPIPNQENAYWIKWTKSGTNYLQISLSSNKPCVAWSTLSESATKSGVWHWDDEKDILYVTLADKNYVICSNYYGQGLKAYEMTDAEAHSGYWWAKIGKLSTREADLQKAPPQATSVEFYTVKGVKLADGAEIALKAESGWNSYFFYKVLPEGAEQGLSIATSTVNKLNVMVNNDQTIGVRIGVGSAGVLGDEVTVTFTVRDTAMTFTFKVKLVENVTVIKGETPENPISIDVLYNRVKRADDVYPGIKVSPGYNRPYYVTGRLHIAEDGTYYLRDDDGKQIKLSKRFNFAGEAAGLTIGDLSEGEVVTLGASWYFIQEDDAKMLASNTVPYVYKADIETDNEKVENVQGRLDVDFTPIKGIDAIGKSVDLTEMANKAKAGEYGVTVKWELTAPTDASTYLEIKDNKLTALKLPEKSTTFTLTATISKEGVETPLTKTFSFNLSYTADVAIAETIKNFAPDYSSLQKAGDMIDLDAAVAAARGESKVYASWANPEANPYWTTKVIDGKMCLVVTEMPKEAMTFTFSGTFILSPGTRVDATFTFTLGPAA